MHTPISTKSGETFKNLDLEVLRCIAIVLTFIVHLPVLFLWKQFPISRYFWAYGGVDLFFVISGYIITTSLLRETAAKLERRHLILRSFWIKRVFRLLPMAYLWTAVPIILSLTFNTSGVFGSTLNLIRDGLANVTQTANFHWQSCSQPAYLPLCGVDKQGQTVLGPYWSLSVEEQFYIIFPLLLLFVRRQWLLYALLLIPILLLFVDRRTHFFYTLRFDSLAAGVLLALGQHTAWYRDFYPKFMECRPIAWLTLLGVSLLIGLIPALSLVPMAQTLIVLLASALVYTASFNQNLFAGSYRRLQALWLWGGDRSYAFYLVHIPAYLTANEIFFRIHHGWSRSAKLVVPAIALMLLLAAAELSNRFVEHPLRKYGRKLAKQLPPGPASQSTVPD